MKVLVCGGRDYDDRDNVFYALDRLNAETPFRMIVEGAASGADTLAYEWAMTRAIACLRVPADWTSKGRGAGAARNLKMLEMVKPDRIVAFPGGTGTANMISQGRSFGVKITEILERLKDTPKGYADSGNRLRLEKNGPIRSWIAVPRVSGRP